MANKKKKENELVNLNKLLIYLDKSGIKHSNSYLYKLAITHPSFNNKENNRRLAFYGDGIIRSIVTKHIYTSNPNATLKEMNNKRDKLIRNSFFNKLIKEDFGFNDLLLINSNIKKQLNPNSKVWADMFEAIVGAIAEDLNENEAEKFINKCILSKYSNFIDNNLQNVNNKKKKSSYSFKLFNLHIKGIEYKNIKNKSDYTSNIFIKKKLFASSSGTSKKIAKENAARIAYEKYLSSIRNNNLS